MGNIGFIGYLLATVAFVIFVLLLIAARNTTLKGHLLLVASLASLVASGLSLFQIEQTFSLRPVLMFEVFKVALWSVLILATRDNDQSSIAVIKNRSIQQYLLITTMAAVTVFTYSYVDLAAVKYIYILFLSLNLWTK